MKIHSHQLNSFTPDIITIPLCLWGARILKYVILYSNVCAYPTAATSLYAIVQEGWDIHSGLEITWTTTTATQHSSIGQRKLLFDAVLHPITPSTRLQPCQIFLHQHLLTANVDSMHFNWYHIRQASKGPTIVADIDLIKSFNCNELFSSYLKLNEIDGHGHSWRSVK